MHTSSIRRYAWAVFAATALLLSAVPADAQYSPQYKPRTVSDPATGEKFHIEAEADLWMPGADMTVSSESFGIQGTTIDLKNDLGITDSHFPALGLQLKPARRHHFRFNYVPVSYDGSARIRRTLVFNGISYAVNSPVNTTFEWKTYRFGYQGDIISTDRGFLGVILEAKYTDVRVELDSQFAQEFAHARGPIPAIGGIARVYVVPNISITGELTGVTDAWVPESVKGNDKAHYFDLDIYGTLNFTNNIGVKGGYKSVDVSYLIKSDQGSFVLKGLYFGAVLRY
jgi:hypothetical protein